MCRLDCGIGEMIMTEHGAIVVQPCPSDPSPNGDGVVGGDSLPVGVDGSHQMSMLTTSCRLLEGQKIQLPDGTTAILQNLTSCDSKRSTK